VLPLPQQLSLYNGQNLFGGDRAVVEIVIEYSGEKQVLVFLDVVEEPLEAGREI